MQCLEKLFGQLQMVFHPALARGMGEVEVQPEKFIAVVRLLQALQSAGRIDFPATFAGAKTETVQQTEQVRIAVALVDAVVHGGSL
ncbi:hypothetical protein D3C87_1421280 [compost metagenome]